MGEAACQKNYRRAYDFMQRASAIYVRQLHRSEKTMAYLRGRGFSETTIRDFRLGYAPREDSVRVALCTSPDASQKIRLAEQIGLVFSTDDGTYRDFMRDRVVFPIYWLDKAGKFQVVAFGGRAMDDANPAKYLNTRRTFLYNKSAIVYGLDRAYRTVLESGRAILVEGYTDCVSAHQAGVRNVVAATGTAFTDESAHILGMYAGSVRVVMDPDEAGERAGKGAVEALRRAGVEADSLSLPGGLDPADFIATHGGDAFAEAVRW